jgi:hypothetical protein
MASKDRKIKDNKDIGQMASRRKPLSRKTRKYIRDALLQNYRGLAKKYNKADLDKKIKEQYELDTILPYAPIYYQEDKDSVIVDSNPANHRTGRGQLFRYKTLDEAENAQHTIKKGVKYDYPTSSPNRDLESGLKHYDFSGRDENYDPEAGKNGGRKATRTSRKSMKTRKIRK